MAKGNLFNGLAHGSVGDVVFTRQNGEQISKMRNRRPRNPRSPGQLIQRAIMSTVWLAYKAGKDIFDHSFEHRSVGGATMNEFVSMNTKILRALVAEEKNIVPTSSNTVPDVRARLVAPGSVYPVAFDGMIISSGTYQQTFFQVIPAHMDEGEEVYLSFLVPAELNDSETCREYAERLGLVRGDLYTLLGFYQPRELPQYLDGFDDGFSHMGMQIQESFFAIRLRVRDDFVNDGTRAVKGCTLRDLFTVDFIRGPQTTSDIILGMGIGLAFNMIDVQTVSHTQELSWANIIRSHVDSKLRSKTVLLRSSMFQDCGVIPAYLVEAWSRVSDKVGDSSLILEGGGGLNTIVPEPPQPPQALTIDDFTYAPGSPVGGLCWKDGSMNRPIFTDWNNYFYRVVYDTEMHKWALLEDRFIDHSTAQYATLVQEGGSVNFAIDVEPAGYLPFRFVCSNGVMMPAVPNTPT